MQHNQMPADKLLGFNNPQYDLAAKRILSERAVAAYLLKGTVPEFKEASLGDIADKYIEGDIRVSNVPINPGKTNTVAKPKKIKGLRNEVGDVTEGWTTFDVIFHAVTPETGERIRLIINIEAQKTFSESTLKYILMKRAVFYGSRLISAQKETEFRGSDYSEVKKVYTIWICMESPTDKSVINHYRMAERHLVGKYKEPQENYDLLNIVMVYLAPGPVRNRLLSMLQVIFQETTKTAEEKSEILRKKFDIEVTAEMEKELRTMCNLSEGIYERGMARGIELGEENVVKNLWKKGMGIDFIKEVTNWTEEQIMKVIKKEKA
ncbi:nuclease [Selenomonas caprae]|uniref:Nuclease n=1 Tax=Selenomonas caprae TaxID=2606905 RepID=A0A5D6WKF3_9FIRM|nr:nuclease [Selenomonas caprae]TYZ27328.1 nuclease [Selenomonas caprae]